MIPLTITVAEFCAITRIGRTTAYALIKAGAVDSCKIGRKRLVTLASVEALVNCSTEATS